MDFVDQRRNASEGNQSDHNYDDEDDQKVNLVAGVYSLDAQPKNFSIKLVSFSKMSGIIKCHEEHRVSVLADW